MSFLRNSTIFHDNLQFPSDIRELLAVSEVERLGKVRGLLQKYKARTAIVIIPHEEFPYKLTTNKYLFPNDFTAAQILITLRQKNKLDSQPLFLNAVLCRGQIGDQLEFTRHRYIRQNKIVREIYNDFSSPDGLLYFILTTENCFG